jgi:hypothetical protein
MSLFAPVLRSRPMLCSGCAQGTLTAFELLGNTSRFHHMVQHSLFSIVMESRTSLDVLGSLYSRLATPHGVPLTQPFRAPFASPCASTTQLRSHRLNACSLTSPTDHVAQREDGAVVADRALHVVAGEHNTSIAGSTVCPVRTLHSQISSLAPTCSSCQLVCFVALLRAPLDSLPTRGCSVQLLPLTLTPVCAPSEQVHLNAVEDQVGLFPSSRLQPTKVRPRRQKGHLAYLARGPICLCEFIVFGLSPSRCALCFGSCCACLAPGQRCHEFACIRAHRSCVMIALLLLTHSMFRI